MGETSHPAPRRVAFVTGQMGGGGAESQLRRLVENLDPREFHSRVLTYSLEGYWARYLLDRGFEVDLIARGGHLEPGRVLRFARLFRSWRPHVVYSLLSDAHHYATPAAVLAGVPGIAFQYGTAGKIRWNRGRRLLEQHLSRYVDVRVGNAVAVSRCITQLLREDARRQWTIYNAVDVPPLDDSARARARRQLDLSDGDFLAGFVASFSPEKQHDVAVRAIARLRDTHPRLRLVMAGDGEMIGETRKLVETTGIMDRCIFLGHRTDAARLLPAFDVTLNCSWREGCCNAILESLAAGVPVLASSVGGTPELVRHGNWGLMHASGDDAQLAGHLDAACSGEMDLAAWGRAGREFVQRTFTMERYLGEMTRLLRALAASPPRRPFARRGRVLRQS